MILLHALRCVIDAARQRIRVAIAIFVSLWLLGSVCSAQMREMTFERGFTTDRSPVFLQIPGPNRAVQFVIPRAFLQYSETWLGGSWRQIGITVADDSKTPWSVFAAANKVRPIEQQYKDHFRMDIYLAPSKYYQRSWVNFRTSQLVEISKTAAGVSKFKCIYKNRSEERACDLAHTDFFEYQNEDRIVRIECPNWPYPESLCKSRSGKFRFPLSGLALRGA